MVQGRCEDFRESAAGSKLFDHVLALGASGCGRMEWQVLDWNTLAREFDGEVRKGAIAPLAPTNVGVTKLPSRRRVAH